MCDVWWKLGVFTLLEVLLFSPLAICTAFCAHSGDLGGGECLWVTLRRSSSIKRHFFALPFLSSNTLWNFLPLSSHLRRLRLRIFLLPECLPYRRHRELTILRRGRKLICDQDWSDSVTLSLCGVSCKRRGLPLSEIDAEVDCGTFAFIPGRPAYF